MLERRRSPELAELSDDGGVMGGGGGVEPDLENKDQAEPGGINAAAPFLGS